jgi:hypothetical protein
MPSKRPYRVVPPAMPDPSSPVPPPAGIEFVFDEFPPRRTLTIALRREDKEVFDALQAWWHFRMGERLTQWGLFSLLLEAALDNPHAPFAEAKFVMPRRNT